MSTENEFKSRLRENAAKILDHLQQVAENKSRIYYDDLALKFGGFHIDEVSSSARGELYRILDDICRDEHKAKRPLLSAVVIRKDANMPGQGFFDVARELGVFPKGSKAKEQERMTFFIQELNRVHAQWGGSA